MITLGLHMGCIGGISVTGIFTLSGLGEFLTSKTGIPGGLGRGAEGGSAEGAEIRDAAGVEGVGNVEAYPPPQLTRGSGGAS